VTDGPLAGLRVLDLSRVLAGPLCTMVLADLGAEVIKVERPGRGDPTRAWGPPFVEGESTYYLCVNRGKRSITLDLADVAGREVGRRLAARADVVVDNFLPGSAARLRLDHATLAAGRPGVVTCSITGYPEDGPDAGRPGFDVAIQAEAGLMAITGSPDGPPTKVGVAVSDVTAGLFATIGVLAALAEARAGGPGRHVEVSLYDAQLAGLINRASDWIVAGEDQGRLGNAHPAIVPYEAFRAADGDLVLAVGTDEQFARFCEVAGLGALAADARFARNAGRVAHRLELVAAIADAISQRTVAEWTAAMAEAGVPGGPVRSMPEVFARLPQAAVEHEHPLLGTVRTVRSPLLLDGSRPTAAAAPPLLGQHTAEVLAEAGYAESEITALQQGPCRAGA
jgi:crotonobetainyl-CoA:carnitine CoA-transferase CaiB-like acyl-CoA transferase